MASSHPSPQVRIRTTAPTHLGRQGDGGSRCIAPVYGIGDYAAAQYLHIRYADGELRINGQFCFTGAHIAMHICYRPGNGAGARVE